MKKLIYVSTALVIVMLFGFIVQKNDSCPLCSIGKDANAQVKSAAQKNAPDEDGNILTLTDGNFESEVLNSDKPVVVEFYATWCGTCKKLSPNFETFAKDHGKMLKFGKIDVDQNPNLAKQYGVDAIPRIVIFEKGKIVKDQIGYESLDDLEKNFCGMCKTKM